MMIIVKNLITITTILFILFNNKINGLTNEDCDDGNPCTSDFYDGITKRCQHIFNQWSGCENPQQQQQQQQQQCSEYTCNRNKSNKCKIFKSCNYGQCVYRDVECNDYNNLSNDWCDPEFGCHFTSAMISKSCNHDYECNDNLSCTQDICLNGKCANKMMCGWDQKCNRYGNCETIPRITNK